MIIRKAKVADLGEIEKLNEKYFKEIRDFKEIIEDKSSYFIICLEKNKIVGFSGIKHSDWNNTANVINIFIHPSFRNIGLASKLLDKLKQEARRLKVRALVAESPSLNSALPFYLKNGFRICGFNDRYYSNNGKEIAMFLSFDLK